MPVALRKDALWVLPFAAALLIALTGILVVVLSGPSPTSPITQGRTLEVSSNKAACRAFNTMWTHYQSTGQFDPTQLGEFVAAAAKANSSTIRQDALQMQEDAQVNNLAFGQALASLQTTCPHS